MSALLLNGGDYELDLPSAEVVPMVAMVREFFRGSLAVAEWNCSLNMGADVSTLSMHDALVLMAAP